MNIKYVMYKVYLCALILFHNVTDMAIKAEVTNLKLDLIWKLLHP